MHSLELLIGRVIDRLFFDQRKDTIRAFMNMYSPIIYGDDKANGLVDRDENWWVDLEKDFEALVCSEERKPLFYV